MNIAIFETVHFENIYPLLRLFDKPGNRITVFCEETAQQQVLSQLSEPSGQFTWVIQKKQQSRSQFIRQMAGTIQREGIELLFLNTVSDNFWHLAWLAWKFRNRRILVTLHSINGYFSPKLKFSLRRLIRASGKWMLRKTIKEYSVQSPVLLTAARERLSSDYPVHLIPGAVFEPGNFSIVFPVPVRLTVAGSVDERRRNYEEVEQLIERLESAHMRAHISLLGAVRTSYARDLIARLSARHYEFVELSCYHHEDVPQQEYDRVLATSHFLYYPSRKEAILDDGAIEIYGETVSSGVFSDAIRHARPMLLPSSLPIDPVFNSCSFRYSSLEEICDLIIGLRNQREKYEWWQNAALEMAAHFTVEKIRTQCPEVFG